MRARIMRAAARPTNKAAASNFTGLVLHEEVFAPEAPSRLRASRVCFTPGGRTNWHTHAVGQVLYVLAGSAAIRRWARRCRSCSPATPSSSRPASSTGTAPRRTT